MHEPVRYRRWPYFLWPIVPLIIICLGWWWFCWGPTTTFLLIRHADRDPGQDLLNPAGVARAQELVHVLQRASVSTIYHSEAASSIGSASRNRSRRDIPSVDSGETK